VSFILSWEYKNKSISNTIFTNIPLAHLSTLLLLDTQHLLAAGYDFLEGSHLALNHLHLPAQRQILGLSLLQGQLGAGQFDIGMATPGTGILIIWIRIRSTRSIQAGILNLSLILRTFFFP